MNPKTLTPPRERARGVKEASSSSPGATPSVASIRHAFWTLIWPRRRLLFVGLFLIFLNRVSGLVLPGAPKFLIDDIIGQGNPSLLVTLVAVIAVAVLFQAVSSFLLTRLLSVEAQQLISELRVRVQTHVLRLPLSYFDSMQSGAIVSRIMNDVEGVRNLIGTGLVQLVGGVLTAAIALCILLITNPLLTLVALIPLVLFGAIALKAFTFLRPIFRERGKIRAEVTGRLTESLGGIRVVKGFSAENREEKVFTQGVHRLFMNVKKTLTASSLVTSGATLLLGLSTVIIMYVGGKEVIAGNLTVGQFVSFTLYLAFLVTPIMQMANIGTQMTEAFAGLDRMEELLALSTEDSDTQRTVVLGRLKGDLRFEQVSFSYEEGKPVLKNVSFRAPAGTVTALVGSSGSGKTTIASLATSFASPDRGTVWIDDIDLSQVTLESYRSQLGLVLQDDFLFEGTIRENIIFARPDATEEALQSAVKSAFVSEFSDGFAEGLDTLIGERGVKLSGGQRQRVAIARALLADPRILILDEATSSLDTESESYIQRSLATLMEGRTTLVIAHRLSTIQRADQILVVESGAIVERGDHPELIERRGRYYDLYTYQARI